MPHPKPLHVDLSMCNISYTDRAHNSLVSNYNSNETPSHLLSSEQQTATESEDNVQSPSFLDSPRRNDVPRPPEGPTAK